MSSKQRHAGFVGPCRHPIYSTSNSFTEDTSLDTSSEGEEDNFMNTNLFDSSPNWDSSEPSNERILTRSDGRIEQQKPCVIEGTLNTSISNWYGFIGNFTIQAGGSMYYRFSYPHHMQIVNVILYRDEELQRFTEEFYGV